MIPKDEQETMQTRLNELAKKYAETKQFEPHEAIEYMTLTIILGKDNEKLPEE